MKKYKNIICIITIIILIVVGYIITRLMLINKSYENNTIELEGLISGISYKIYQDYSQGTFNYSERGYYETTLNQPNSPYWYIITMGERNTGGYDIQIIDVKIDAEKNVEVIVQETHPKKGDIVTMAFTYPACCLELSEYANTIRIKNTKGEVFNDLKP